MNNKVKLALVSLLILGLTISPVMAQTIATQDDAELAGINPNSFLYSIDLFIDRVTEIFSDNAKVLHIQERLAETKMMISQNRLDMAEKSVEGFERLRLRIQNQSIIQEHNTLMDSLGQKVKEINQAGQMTEENRMQISNIIQTQKIKIQEESLNLMVQSQKMTQEQASNTMTERIQKQEIKIPTYINTYGGNK